MRLERRDDKGLGNLCSQHKQRPKKQLPEHFGFHKGCKQESFPEDR